VKLRVNSVGVLLSSELRGRISFSVSPVRFDLPPRVVSFQALVGELPVEAFDLGVLDRLALAG
jgi:hypothetical protein